MREVGVGVGVGAGVGIWVGVGGRRGSPQSNTPEYFKNFSQCLTPPRLSSNVHDCLQWPIGQLYMPVLSCV